MISGASGSLATESRNLFHKGKHMSYRKITVNGKSYEYVIGKTNTKIKGIGIFVNEKIAEGIAYYEECSCAAEGYENCYEGDPEYLRGDKSAVTPSIIKQLILKHV